MRPPLFLQPSECPVLPLSALHCHTLHELRKLVRMIMKQGLRHKLTAAGRTPLHYAAMHGRVAAVEVLVKAGAALNEKDVRGGYSPLHLAADAGQCEAITRLVQLGAPLETRSTKGWTPLALATLKASPPPNAPCSSFFLHRMHAVCALHRLTAQSLSIASVVQSLQLQCGASSCLGVEPCMSGKYCMASRVPQMWMLLG